MEKQQHKKNDQLLLVAAGAAAFWWFFIRDKNPVPGAAAIAPGEPVSLPVVTTAPVVALPPATSQVNPSPVMTAIAPANYNPAAGRCSGIGCLQQYADYVDVTDY